MRPKELRGLRTAFIFIVSFTLIAIMVACGGTSSTGQVHNYDELQNLISSRDFQIENDWANPSGGGNINLIGNPNFIRFSGDSVEVYLPYFGVRHAGAGYGREGGIKYKGPAEDFNISENAEKKNIEVDFEGKQGGENLEFHIKLFANGSSFTSVNTSQRSTISYQGTVSRVEEE
ncbi:DUF4251 domain-containing protein [Gramella jeungdoensis]|uniref:DUF4251 domain-containing protein n=1 Tax=Gramella jeungdoensis TaxID=708091 RepID=A0ABT0Z302_9FLAO|nr:DUF4251 domain-containing protein [Gramella jeungdoensis]MCM8570107.1 DUF4251 domain-containing protein [Gramella jeungdoensis]